MQKNVLAEKGFIHVMGPSPAIIPGEKDSWDGWILECCDVLKNENTYYWYYHARGDKALYPKGYRVGVATAPTPLGPWTRFQANPVLDYGPVGSWDEGSVDCACVMKEGSYDLPLEKAIYYMWFSASGKTGRHIGLATAPSPLGPWTKYEGNPVIEDFGYLGSVVKVNGKFYMYTQYPVGITDQGPFCVATADRPEGPWLKYKENPILTPGDWGAWDDGGFSEAGVRYNDGIFHWFHGGTKTLKLESIGYAYSLDGFKFEKYPGNPIIPLSSVPGASGFAEVKHLIEPPFIYIYHTLRYFSNLYRDGDHKHDWATEHLAIQVLSTSPTFRIPFPVIHITSLKPGKESTLEQCCPVSLGNASSCALTLECTFASQAKVGLRLHVLSSPNGITYDTQDLCTFDFVARAGETIRKTVELMPKVRFLKATCENLDMYNEVSSVIVIATLGR